MKNLKVATTILALSMINLTAMSCNEQKKEMAQDEVQTEINYNKMSSVQEKVVKVQNPQAAEIVANYMELKDALVATNKDDAAKTSQQLEGNLNTFYVTGYSAEQQTQLNVIIANAKELAEHISNSEMAQQRQHFKALSKAVVDLVAITGTEATLYQQFCPMYDKGSSWLSLSKEIRNPYYGDKMLACGRVEKVID